MSVPARTLADPAGVGANQALWTALGALDLLLAHALSAAVDDPRLAPPPSPSPEAAALLLRPDPGGPALAGHRDVAGTGAGLLDEVAEEDPWATVALAFDLDRFDLDVLLLALAPALDARYRSSYAALRGTSGGWPTVELALALLCDGPDDRLRRRDRFSADAPLIRAGVVRFCGQDDGTGDLLQRGLYPDPQVTHLVCGASGLDQRLERCARVEQPAVGWDELPLEDLAADRLARLVDGATSSGAPCRLLVRGAAGAGRRTIARAVATRAGAPLLTVDLPRLVGVGSGARGRISVAFRHAWFWGHALVLDDLSAVASDRPAWDALCEGLADSPGLVVLTAGSDAPRSFAPALGVMTVPVGVAGPAVRRRLWAARLAAHRVAVAAGDVDLVAERFRLPADDIAQAAAEAVVEAAARGPEAAQPPAVRGEPAAAVLRLGAQDLFAAARGRSRGGLGELARRVVPRHGWPDLVLPDDVVAQLHEVCARAALRETLLDDWGFGGTGTRGSGTAVLFTGPSGTGKTSAAEVVAGELGLDLFAIDLSAVVSKYIGETEKNLELVFVAAEGSNAVLLFDEADALFGRRSSVRDAHDRYANVEVSYLLQRLERYEGVAVLASNLPDNLDDAFARRLAATIHFPFPDESVRRRIWQGVWPPQVRLEDDVDVDRLAKERFSGGSIRNVALAAAFLAASAGKPVGMAQLRLAVRREHQKLGRALDSSET